VTDLPKPKEGDILTLDPDASDLDEWEKGVVIQVHDDTTESWDPYGEHAMSQRDMDESRGKVGKWYAIIEHPKWPGSTMSVASYEVKDIEESSLNDDEVIITIDNQRSISVRSTKDGTGIVLTLEDPHSIAVVQIPRPDVVALYEALEDWIKKD